MGFTPFAEVVDSDPHFVSARESASAIDSHSIDTAPARRFSTALQAASLQLWEGGSSSAASTPLTGMAAVGSIYSGYGKVPGGKIRTKGTAYLQAEFPRLSYIVSASIVHDRRLRVRRKRKRSSIDMNVITTHSVDGGGRTEPHATGAATSATATASTTTATATATASASPGADEPFGRKQDQEARLN
jgi:hypothetical protein